MTPEEIEIDRQASFKHAEKLEEAGKAVFDAVKDLDDNSKLSLLRAHVDILIRTHYKADKDKGIAAIDRFTDNLKNSFTHMSDITNGIPVVAPSKHHNVLD